MKNKSIFFVVILFFSVLNRAVFAQTPPDAREIVKRSDDLMRGESHQGLYTMRIQTPSWQRELKLEVASLGRDKIFIRILSPDKEKGVSTLRIKNEMWNYLPRIERTIKIPPSLMLQPWMGSDFANDDLVRESSIVNDYTHKILKEEIWNGQKVYIIQLLPKPAASVIWGKIILSIRKGDDVPLREEYYSDKGKLIKVLEFSDIEKVSGRVIPRLWKMTPVNKPGHSTTIRVVDVQYNQPLDQDIFTLINLKRVQ